MSIMSGVTVEASVLERDARSVAVITMAAAPANALGDALVESFSRALDEVERADVRAVVIASGLEAFFAAGGDLKLFAKLDAAGFDAYLTRVTNVIERLPAIGVPSIAAIEGQALGGGLELALACSLRVAGAGATMGTPEIKLGLLPGAGGTQRLTRLLGRAGAIDLLLAGRTVTAQEAERLGLVDRVTPAGAALDSALELAFELASRPRLAVRAILRCVDAAAATTLVDGLAFEGREVRDLFATDDAHEGIAAFLERRTPRFE